METNRIDLAFTLAKSTQGRSTASAGAGDFADMLLGAMGQKSSTVGADKSQVKPAETYTQRRRFDDYRPYHYDPRDDAANRADRRVDNNQTRARQGSDDISVGAGRNTQQQTDATAHHSRAAHTAGRKEQCASDVTEVGADNAVDPTNDVEATEGEQEAAVGGEGCDKQASDNDANDSGTPLIVAATPVALPEEPPATTFELDAAGEAAAATSGTANASAATGASPEDIADAAALAATVALPTAPGQDDIVAPADGDADKAAATEAAKQGVTFAATLALTDTADDAAAQAEGHAQAIAARNEQQIEDAGSSFRRNTANTRRNQGNGTGTTGTPANTAHPSTAAAAVAAAEAHANAATATTTPPASGFAPIGFDTGLGNAAGLSGWNLHLGQGAAIRRGDFVANLRQHLQNLPAHEQVALSIQRSLRDGGGNITLQLSPAELGRIHLKLKIDEENNVQASVVVERPATLELLQRDMKALERALQEAGLKAGPGDLSFSLQGGDPEAFAREFGSGSGNGSNASGRSGGSDGADDTPAAVTAAVVDTADGWVDVQV